MWKWCHKVKPTMILIGFTVFMLNVMSSLLFIFKLNYGLDILPIHYHVRTRLVLFNKLHFITKLIFLIFCCFRCYLSISGCFWLSDWWRTFSVHCCLAKGEGYNYLKLVRSLSCGVTLSCQSIRNMQSIHKTDETVQYKCMELYAFTGV